MITHENLVCAVYNSQAAWACPIPCNDAGRTCKECAEELVADYEDELRVEGKRLATAWIPVTERLPENEETVLITVERRPFGGKPYRRVTKAFHEDGNMNTEDSGYCWDTSEGDWEYDEKSDGYIVPEGWYEDTDYCEVIGIIDDFVIAWMPLPEPYKEK